MSDGGNDWIAQNLKKQVSDEDERRQKKTRSSSEFLQRQLLEERERQRRAARSGVLASRDGGSRRADSLDQEAPLSQQLNCVSLYTPTPQPATNGGGGGAALNGIGPRVITVSGATPPLARRARWATVDKRAHLQTSIFLAAIR